MKIPTLPSEYEVWRDERDACHFRVRGSPDDMLLRSWTWWEDSRVLIRRFDTVNKKYRMGFCSPDHPLVIALGLRIQR